MRCLYDPVTDPDRMFAAFGVTPTDGAETGLPAGAEMAAFIVDGAGASPEALGEVRIGQLGLLPASAQGDDRGDAAQECRVDTMKSHPRFRESWWAGRRCVVPIEQLTAWCYEVGRPQAWRVRRADGAPLALAGLWNEVAGLGGERRRSFCVLTLDATGHAVFGRLRHPLAPQARMPAILPGAMQRRWLHGALSEAHQLLVPFDAEALQAAPLTAADAASGPAPGWSAEPDLFAEDGWRIAPPTPRPKPVRPRGAARPRSADTPGPVTADLFAGA